MSDLYSDLPAASGGKGGDGVNVGSWIQRKPQQPRIQPRARTSSSSISVVAAAAPRVGGFNPLSGRASQSPLLLASSDGSKGGGGGGGAGTHSVQSLQQRLAAASAKLAAKSKSILGANDDGGGNNVASRNGGEGASSPKNGSGSGSAGDNGSEIFSSIPDEYDPRQPNDYADYCERRLAQKKKDLAKRDLERQVRKLEEERRRAKEDDAKQGYSALRSAVEVARAGGRGRGRALTVPAWMMKKENEGPGASSKTSMKMPPPPPSFHASSSSASSSSAATKVEPGQFDDADNGNPDFGGSSLNKAARMMSRMGYQKGRGLGAKEDGIASALVHESTGRGMGKLVAGAPPRPPGFFTKVKSEGVEGSSGGRGSAGRGRGRGRGMGMPAPPPTSGVGSAPPVKRLKTGVKNPSPVILLRNMVGPGEVDDALEGEIQGECTKFGGVVKVMIFEVKNLEAARCPKEGAVRIFVEFQSLAGAMKAVQDLDGRFFAKRRISAVFFPKKRFEALDLQPKAGEPPLQL